MKINLRGRFFYILLLSFMLYVPAHADDLSSSFIDFQLVYEMMPFSQDEIVYKFRTYNGKLQYRRWNQTRNRWEDPAWIDY